MAFLRIYAANVVANIEKWARMQPDVLEVSQRLNAADIVWGYFSGALAELAGVRATDDLDVLVSPADFMATARVFNSCPVRKMVELRSADDRLIRFSTEEIVARVGQANVQVMRPGPMVAEHTIYELDMTPLAAEHRISREVDGTLVHLANPFDTLAAKAVMWRGAQQGKCDPGDITALRAACSVDPTYARARGQEIGLTDIEWGRLGDLALGAQPSTLYV
jgi:hypothetical protein